MTKYFFALLLSVLCFSVFAQTEARSDMEKIKETYMAMSSFSLKEKIALYKDESTVAEIQELFYVKDKDVLYSLVGDIESIYNKTRGVVLDKENQQIFLISGKRKQEVDPVEQYLGYYASADTVIATESKDGNTRFLTYLFSGESEYTKVVLAYNKSDYKLNMVEMYLNNAAQPVEEGEPADFYLKLQINFLYGTNAEVPNKELLSAFSMDKITAESFGKNYKNYLFKEIKLN